MVSIRQLKGRDAPEPPLSDRQVEEYLAEATRSGIIRASYAKVAVPMNIATLAQTPLGDTAANRTRRSVGLTTPQRRWAQHTTRLTRSEFSAPLARTPSVRQARTTLVQRNPAAPPALSGAGGPAAPDVDAPERPGDAADRGQEQGIAFVV